MPLMETREQSSSWQMSDLGQSGIPLINRQLLPCQAGQLLEQRQDSVRFFLDGHLQALASEIETAKKRISLRISVRHWLSVKQHRTLTRYIYAKNYPYSTIFWELFSLFSE